MENGRFRPPPLGLSRFPACDRGKRKTPCRPGTLQNVCRIAPPSPAVVTWGAGVSGMLAERGPPPSSRAGLLSSLALGVPVRFTVELDAGSFGMSTPIARVRSIEGGIEFDRRPHAELDEFAVFLLQLGERLLVAEGTYEPVLFERAKVGSQCADAVRGLDISLHEMFQKASGRVVHGAGPCTDQDRTYDFPEAAADATAWRWWLIRRPQSYGLTFEYAQTIYRHAKELRPGATLEYRGKPGRPRIPDEIRRFVVQCLLALEGFGLPVTSRSPERRYAGSPDESLASALGEALTMPPNTIALIWREAMYRIPKQSRQPI